jgi:hypothetical protein
LGTFRETVCGAAYGVFGMNPPTGRADPGSNCGIGTSGRVSWDALGVVS